MITWCKSLKSAIESDSKWKASIPFPSSNARSLNEAIYRKASLGSLSKSSSFASISSSICGSEDTIVYSNDKNNSSLISNDNSNELSHYNNIIFES